MAEPLSDRSKFWTASPDWASAAIDRDDWRARAVLGLGQVLVSGRIAGAVDPLAGAPESGCGSVAAGNTHVVRICPRPRADRLGRRACRRARLARWLGGSAGRRYLCGAGDRRCRASALVSRGGVGRSRRRQPVGSNHVRRHPCLLYRTGQTTARLHVGRLSRLCLALAGKAWRRAQRA